MGKQIKCIYKIESKINSKVYIGQTINLMKRESAHKRKLITNKHENVYLQNHFNKHNRNKKFEDVFSITVIEQCDIKTDLSQKEIYWINFYDSTNPYKGFNLCVGGRQVKLCPRIEEKRKETLRSKSVPIYMYDLKGNLVKQFRSITDASEELNICTSRIFGAIKKEFRCGEFYFSKNLVGFKEYTSRNWTKVYVYTIEGVFVGHYNSICITAKEMKLNRNAVSNALNRGIRYKNYLFYREPKTFDKYIPNKSRKELYINVHDIQGNLVDRVYGLKECAQKYNMNINTLNSRCRRRSIVGGIYFQKELDSKLGEL